MEEGMNAAGDIREIGNMPDTEGIRKQDSLDLSEWIRQEFGCKKQDIRTYSPLALAFMGDCVYEIIVRTVAVGRGNRQPQKLYQDTTRIVKASNQFKIYDALLTEVSEEERDIMRRGYNAHFHTKAKNATAYEYKKATGVEALFGYLYLTGRMERSVELLELGIQKCGLML